MLFDSLLFDNDKHLYWHCFYYDTTHAHGTAHWGRANGWAFLAQALVLARLLDKPDSYSETSCTAMFVAAIAHGVNKGWIDSSFASVALQGWKAVCSQITPEGQVKNVCMGTGISRDLPFYYNRPAPLNDAHGLGAVVQAGIEINNVKTKT